jgi:2'-hydroxyisoflavone reductase
MKLLVLGGTRFVGLHIVQAALDAGFEVTLLNRGKTGPALFPQCEQVLGDRATDLRALKGRRFDTVLDACGYLPRELDFSIAALRDSVERYCFVSTVSVYASFAQANTESSPLARIDDPDTEVIDARTYGALKVLCEERVRAAFGERALLLRPGLVVGPLDYTQRFTYWLARTVRGTPFIAPGLKSDALQFIDARDLAAFTVHVLNQRLSGAYNVVNDPGAVTCGQLIDSCAEVSGVASQARWAPREFLQQQHIAPWSDLPAWFEPSAEFAGFAHTSNARARAAGLRPRALHATVAQLYDWWQVQTPEERSNARAGLSGERERIALEALNALSMPLNAI